MAEPQYRVWNIIDAPRAPIHLLVASPEEALEAISRIAKVQLLNPRIESSAFGLEVFGDPEQWGDEWGEWHDDEDRDISELIESVEEVAGE